MLSRKTAVTFRWIFGGLVAAAVGAALWAWSWSAAASRRPAPQAPLSPLSLADACGQMGAWAAQQIEGRGRVILRPPWVIAGDLGEAELDRRHRAVIAPVAEALMQRYFTTRPDRPICVLLLENEAGYRRTARRSFGESDISPYGYYRPHLRTLLVNAAQGDAPLVHELTHALAAFDFPDAPDWLSEGLASLYEQYRIDPRRHEIEGLVNRRLPLLKQALRGGRLRPLESLLGGHDFHGPQQALNYARACYFCMFLERRGTLAEFYAQCRDGRRQDPCGEAAVVRLFGGRSWRQIDAEFQGFVMPL
jgi:hypothetical protein